MIPPCLTLSNIRYVLRVKWSNPGKGLVPSPTPQCGSYWKGSLLVALDYGRQLYFTMYIYIYIYIYIYTYTHTHIYICGAFNKFPDFFVQVFRIVVDSWKFSILLLYILWDDWLIFMISRSNEQLQQQLEYTLLKPDYHSWWISKMQSGREDTLEEWYAIKLCFKLGKNATET